MPLYHSNASNMPQLAQGAMNAATSAAASQQKQTTTTTRKENDFWDDLYKGARAIQAGAGAVNSIAGTVEKGVKLYDDLKIKSAYDDVSKAFAEGGYDAIQNNPDMQNYHHMQALGKFVQDRANSEKGRLEIMKKADEAADRIYQNWRLQAINVAKAWQAGDMDRYMAGMQQLAANSPMPYKLELDGNGNFKEMFRSDEKGGWTETGRTITPQQAFEQMNGIMRGEQMVLRGVDGKLHPINSNFANAARRYMYATMMGNAQNRLDPKKQIPLYDKEGNFGGMAVIQNPVDDYNAGPKLFVYGKNGKSLGVYDDYQGVMQAGLSPFNTVAGRGGRAGRGGGGRRGGVGSAAQGSQPGADYSGNGNYKVSESDRKSYADYFTTKNEDGEKKTDWSAANKAISMQRRFGRPKEEIFADYEEAYNAAIDYGLGEVQAKQAALDNLGKMYADHLAAKNGKRNQQSQPSEAPQEEKDKTTNQETSGLNLPSFSTDIPMSEDEQFKRAQFYEKAAENERIQKDKKLLNKMLNSAVEDLNAGIHGSGKLKGLQVNIPISQKDYALSHEQHQKRRQEREQDARRGSPSPLDWYR